MAVWIEGEPTSFLTPLESAWKEKLRSRLVGFIGPAGAGIRLSFKVTSWKRRGNHFDIDNITKPVLDVLGFADALFVDTAAELSSNPGVEVAFAHDHRRLGDAAHFWIKSAIVGSVRRPDPHRDLPHDLKFSGAAPLRVHLTIHEPLLLTNFGFTGFVKPTLDSLWPVLGGSSLTPSDHRIHHLIVARSSERPSGVSVAIEEIA